VPNTLKLEPTNVVLTDDHFEALITDSGGTTQNGTFKEVGSFPVKLASTV
jgi:hypothetical protein